MTVIDLNDIIGPVQSRINKDSILEMITWVPRRNKLSIEWLSPLHPPNDKYINWSLVLPFCETLRNAFDSMCNVNSKGLREGKGRCYTFLNDAKDNPEELIKARNWLNIIGKYVSIRDCLALSFALDYDRFDGNPRKPHTRVGALRNTAKPYGKKPTSETFEAADELIKCCLEFIENVYCYKSADIVVAMPPSDPAKPFNLPSYLSAGIAKGLGKPDLTSAITTIHPRAGLKEVPLENKLDTLEGSIAVDENTFQGKTVLLIDDLYQSGISMNYSAMLILEAGAKRIFGLACDKNCSNDDNIRRR